MKNISLIILLVLFAYCSAKKNNAADTGKESYLDSLALYMPAFAKDTAIIYDVRLAEDENVLDIVGKFIDSTRIFALSIIPEDTIITFHRFDNNNWKKIGSHTAISDVIFMIDFIDMDNDRNNEIIVRTPPNMNGNTWQDVFRYSVENDSIELAGSFSTDFEIKKENKTVEVTYEGSWYMTPEKTLYQWHNNRLIAIKMISLPLKTDTKTDDRIFRYYENPFTDKDTLVLKIEAPYKGKKYKDMWDNFFEKAGNAGEE